MTIAHITAVFGGIDTQKEVPPQTLPADRYYYTDGANFMLPMEYNDRTKALFFKQQHHKIIPGYDLYIWTDGKVQIVASDFYQQLVEQLGDNDLGIMKHHERTCVYQEVDHIYHCISKGNEYLKVRYNHRPLREQNEIYKKAGYPKGNGLNDCCIIISRNTEAIREIFDEWWEVCSTLDWFDQTAIQFICWKSGLKIVPIVLKKDSYIDVPHIVLK